jgi:hypothetical protein
MGPVRPIREENEMGRARWRLHVHACGCMIMQMTHMIDATNRTVD